MSMLERYAVEKEREFEELWRALMNEFKRDEMTEEQLNLGVRKAFQLGHHAGHCRGEVYKRTTLEELVR